MEILQMCKLLFIAAMIHMINPVHNWHFDISFWILFKYSIFKFNSSKILCRPKEICGQALNALEISAAAEKYATKF